MLRTGVMDQIIAGYGLKTPAGQRSALEEAAPVFARIREHGALVEVAVQLAGKLGDLDTDLVVRRVKLLARETRGNVGQADAERRPPHTTKPTLNLRDPVHLTERELLKVGSRPRQTLGTDGCPGGTRGRTGQRPLNPSDEHHRGPTATLPGPHSLPHRARRPDGHA
jgi:hypothetical protein